MIIVQLGHFVLACIFGMVHCPPADDLWLFLLQGYLEIFVLVNICGPYFDFYTMIMFIVQILNTYYNYYLINRFAPGTKSTRFLLADLLGGVGGLDGK